MSVIMITGPGCGQCKAAKSFMKMLNMNVTEENIRESTWAQSKAAELGLQTLPIILSGDTVIVGFQPTKLRALAASTATPTPAVVA